MRRRSDVDRVVVDQVGGTFVVTAKKGKSLDYQEVSGVLAKKQKPKWLEISVVGGVTRDNDQLDLKATATGERFLLSPEPPPKEALEGKKGNPFQKLEAALKAGKKVTAVSGTVHEGKAEKGKPKPSAMLRVTGFETAEE